MPAYRFCRPDDIPLLVRAINGTYNVHFPGVPECTVSGFKEDVRELQLWSSSCMIALEGSEIMGVCIGCKREKETLIYKIGIHPRYLRQGHGRHILQSLRQKFSVLGPPRLVAEVPQDFTEVCRFFSHLGYEPKGTYYDYQLTEALPESTHRELLAKISWQELKQNNLLAPVARSWIRADESLENIKDKISGVAIISPERIEAFLLYRLDDAQQAVTILRFWCARREHVNNEQQLAFTSLLLSSLNVHQPRSVMIPKISAEEIPLEILSRLGFSRTKGYTPYAIEANESDPNESL